MKSIIPLLFVLLSCSPKNDSKDLHAEEINIDSTEVIKDDGISENTEEIEPENDQKPLFEVAVVDAPKGYIQRLFVVIPEDKVFDIRFIRNTVCELENKYDLETKSNISFFTERKYANYYTEVFPSIGAHIELTPDEVVEYENWKKVYYLGEYEHETHEYATYPSSGNSKKMKDFELEMCE